MMGPWHQSVHTVTCAEEDLAKKQTILNKLLSE